MPVQTAAFEQGTIPSQARVVVIGGGVAGASALYHLARLGWTDSVLIERNELTSGSTWHAAGNCPNFATIESLMRLQRYSNRLYLRLGTELGSPVDFHVTGAVRLAQSRGRMDEFRHLTALARRLGIRFEMLGVEEAKARFPFADLDGVLGAQWDPDDGDIDPAQLTQAFAKGARDLGARIARFCNVTAIRALPGGAWRIETGLGPITAEIVVNAAGYRAGEVGAMLGRELPCVPIAHQYVVTEPIPALASLNTKLPLLRDPDDGWYLRQEGQGLLLGIYGKEPVAPWQEGVPADFAFALFPDDMDKAQPELERAIRRVKLLGSAGVRRIINGPIPYTPDGNPLIGPAPGLRNVFECCVFSFGIAQAGGAGKTLAEWVVEGETEWDLWAVDPRRFTGHVTRDRAVAHALDVYRNEYAIAYPMPQPISYEPARKSPLFARLSAQGAVFIERNGWSWAAWFRAKGEGAEEAGFGWPGWFEAVGAECRAVMNGVGLIEMPGASRFEISGRGAVRWLDAMLASRLPEVGKVAAGLCCSEQGSPLCLLTVARLEEDRFWLLGSPESQWHDRDWLRFHLPQDRSVVFSDLTADYDRLLIAGPRSHELLRALSPNADCEDAVSDWLEIGGTRLLRLGIGGLGEQGFELHVAYESTPAIHERITGLAADFGLGNFGFYALESFSLEMAAPKWKTEVEVGRSVPEAGLAWLVDLEKPCFVGRAAVIDGAVGARKHCFAPLLVEKGAAPPLAGSSLFRGEERVGVVTSGGFGHRIGRAIALSSLEADCALAGTRLEIEILGQRRPAEVGEAPLYRRAEAPEVKCRRALRPG